MKTSRAIPRLSLVLVLFGLPATLCSAQSTNSQTQSTQPAASTPSASSTSKEKDEAAKATERKKRFEEEKRRLENAGPRPQTASQPQAASSDCHASPDDLSLSPNLVNMLVGDTQRFSLFDVAGHKLTSQADWSVDDSSVADLSSEGGTPVLTAKQTGTVRLTARVFSHYAEATVNVIAPEDMKPGTIRWSAPPVPCFKPAGIYQAVPTAVPPARPPSQ